RLSSARFLFFYLLSQRRALIEAGQGGAQPNLSNALVRDWVIPLPPLAEQRRIVSAVDAVLARVNAARDRLNRVPAILKRFRQSVLSAACSGRLTADWREKIAIEPADSLVARILVEKPRRKIDATNLPEIPASWTWVYLPETGYMNRGKSRNRPRNA